jgi:arsenate-mycothiol transferase
MAAALMRKAAGDLVEVHSAGTSPGRALNAESVSAVAEVGASMLDEHPRAIDPGLLARVDRVVVLGREAVVAPVDGMAATVQTWETVEPSREGIAGMERVRLIRDDVAARVEVLLADLVPSR